MSKKYKDHYLPVKVIIAATQGEAAAIQTVLKTYESYFGNKSIKTVYDERGLVYYGIDTDKKDFMERRLIHAVVENFKIDRLGESTDRGSQKKADCPCRIGIGNTGEM